MKKPPAPPAARSSSAVGAGAAALPFYRLLEDSVAQAAGETLPLRFIGVYHPHGIAAEYFAMLNGTFSGLEDTETDFDLTYTNSSTQCVLQPFDDAATYGKSFKSKILVIEGIDLLSNANGHDSAGTILTGSRIDDRGKPANSSLDQFLAVETEAGRGDAGHQHRAGRRRRRHAVGHDAVLRRRAARRCPRSSTRCRRSTRCSRTTSPTNDPAARRRRMRQHAPGHGA